MEGATTTSPWYSYPLAIGLIIFFIYMTGLVLAVLLLGLGLLEFLCEDQLEGRYHHLRVFLIGILAWIVVLIPFALSHSLLGALALGIIGWISFAILMKLGK